MERALAAGFLFFVAACAGAVLVFSVTEKGLPGVARVLLGLAASAAMAASGLFGLLVLVGPPIL